MHMYADDTPLYMSCKVVDRETAVSRMEVCVEDVKQWMSDNFLMLNDSKTEVLVLSKPSRCKDVAHIKTTNIGNSCVNVVSQAKNIGCFIDSNVTMEAQVNNVTRNFYASIHQIGRIRSNLTEEAAAILINSQVT